MAGDFFVYQSSKTPALLNQAVLYRDHGPDSGYHIHSVPFMIAYHHLWAVINMPRDIQKAYALMNRRVCHHHRLHHRHQSRTMYILEHGFEFVTEKTIKVQHLHGFFIGME